MPPAFFDLAWRAWRSDQLIQRLAAIAIIAILNITTYEPLEFASLFALAPIFYVGVRIFAKSANWTDRISWTMLGSVAGGFVLWTIFRAWLFFSLIDKNGSRLSPIQQSEEVMLLMSRCWQFPLAVLIVGVYGCRLTSNFRGAMVVAAAILFQISLWTFTQSDFGRRQQPLHEEFKFAERFLAEKTAVLLRPPTVFVNVSKLEVCWLDWRARAFYKFDHTAGIVFNRSTAIEVGRRARLVAPFEGWDSYPIEKRKAIQAWIERPVDKDYGPRECDIFRLARESELDYILLVDVHFENLACAKHGALSIYDCRQLRETRFKAR
jgi:hypothetical protein